MTKVAIIRCEKNETRCPLTNCFKSMMEKREAFANYDECMPAGIFTCRCPGDNALDLAKILKAKGAEAIHYGNRGRLANIVINISGERIHLLSTVCKSSQNRFDN